MRKFDPLSSSKTCFKRSGSEDELGRKPKTVNRANGNKCMFSIMCLKKVLCIQSTERSEHYCNLD